MSVAEGFSWTDDDGQEVVHVSDSRRYDVSPGGYDATHARTSLTGKVDARHISGRSEVTLRKRFDENPEHLTHLLRSRKGREITYWRRAPGVEDYPSYLVGVDSRRVQVVGDEGLWFDHQYEVTLTLRAQTTSLSYEPLYSPWLLKYQAGHSIRHHTFSRNSAALYVDGSGVYQSSAAHILRSHHYVDGRPYALHEPGATNAVRNPNGAGASVGDVGSGGTLPTHWNDDIRGTGLTLAVVEADVTRRGIRGVVLRLHGTRSGGQVFNLIEMDTSGVSVTAGDDIAASLFFQLDADAGPDSPSQYAINPSMVDAVVFVPDGSLQRPENTEGANSTGTSVHRLDVQVADGDEVDVTFFVGHPQFVDGAEVVSSPVSGPADGSLITTSRATEAWRAPWPYRPQVFSSGGALYVRSLDLGVFQDIAPASHVLVQGGTPGNAVSPDNAFGIVIVGSEVRGRVRAGGASFQSTLSGAALGAEVGDRVDLLLEIRPDSGQYRAVLHWRKEGGAWSEQTASGLFSLPESWSGDQLAIGSRGDGLSGGLFGLSRVAIFDSPVGPMQVERIAG